MNFLDLFSGIGGFSLGLERAGHKTKAFCEIDPFCRRVLAKHWPNVPCYEDIRLLTAERLTADGIAVDAVCGGFPCQDISNAGRGEGIDGARSGLWADYARIIGELRPSYIIVENVSALLSRGLGRVLGDLAALGYDAEWHCIPASAVGLPHGRDRIWVLAYPKQNRRIRLDKSLKDSFATLYKPRSDPRWSGTLQLLPTVGEFYNYRGTDIERNDNGLPEELDALGAIGNSVVPQIVELLGRCIHDEPVENSK